MTTDKSNKAIFWKEGIIDELSLIFGQMTFFLGTSKLER